MEEVQNDKTLSLITLTTDIVAAHVSNNSVATGDLPVLIRKVYDAMAGLGASGPTAAARPEPAVTVRTSVKQDHIACLTCGKKFKTMKRHLKSEHGMTPAEYRAHWELADSYPMVASDYAEKRRSLAKSNGLGRKPGQKRGRRKAAAKQRELPPTHRNCSRDKRQDRSTRPKATTSSFF